MKSTLTVLLSALSLSACASYAPAPIEPSALAAEARTRTLNLEQVREKVATIAPDAGWSGSRLDRLALFAGALLNNRDIAAARAGVDSAQAAAKASRVGPAATLTLSEVDPGQGGIQSNLASLRDLAGLRRADGGRRALTR